MSWIRTVKEDVATGLLRNEYDKAIQRAGRVFEILEIQSLKPEYISSCIALYIKAMFGPSRLTRAQREMMAVVVSVANRCHY